MKAWRVQSAFELKGNILAGGEEKRKAGGEARKTPLKGEAGERHGDGSGEGEKLYSGDLGFFASILRRSTGHAKQTGEQRQRQITLTRGECFGGVRLVMQRKEKKSGTGQTGGNNDSGLKKR